MAVKSASDVYSSEVDLSQIVRTQAATIGAIVAASNRGPLGPTLLTNTREVDEIFGPSDLTVSYGHQAAKEYLSVANQLWFNRIAGDGYQYAGVLLQNQGTTGSRTLSLTGFGTDDPENIDFASAGSADELDDNLVFFYSIGPGSFYNGYKVAIVSDNIDTPSGVNATVTETGGSLTTGSYSYRVSALGKLGETVASTAVSASVNTGITEAKITVTWSAVPGAVGYRIYGRSSGSEELIASTNAGVVSYVDTGSITPDGALPAGYTETDQFTVEVYDDSVNPSIPVENFVCTLNEQKDGFNQQMEVSYKINAQSKYIRAVNNSANLVEGIPKLKTLSAVNLSGGNNGAAVTNAEISEGWDAFADRDLIRVSILINAGYATPTIQSKMNQIALARKDSIVLLDTPSTKQEAVDAIAYRRLESNINSNRCAIFTPDIEIADPESGQVIFAPPSGFVAARLAFTDFTTNAGRSPAGLNRGVIPSALGQRVNYTDGQRQLLASNQVNYFRSFVGQGTVLWEQLTMQSQLTALSFLSVRRIFDVMEISIEEALRYTLHEPNDDFSRDQIVSLLTEFLQNLQRNRNIQAFEVVADDRNNSAFDTGSGQLNVDVYITPTLPINKIQLRTIITKQGASFEELIAA